MASWKKFHPTFSVGLIGLTVNLTGTATALERHGDLRRPSRLSVPLQIKRRGESAGEQHLALAAYYAKLGRQPQAVAHLRTARRYGIERSRIDLLLGELYRRVGRYDASLSVLVRVLVQLPAQPHALVQLWRTLYEATLRQAPVQTDTETIRRRLGEAGLHFPERLNIGPRSAGRSRKLTAAGYTALLAKRNDQAMSLFREAIDALPSNGAAHRGTAIAWGRLGAPARASAAYWLYLDITSNAVDADEIDLVLMRYWRSRRKR